MASAPASAWLTAQAAPVIQAFARKHHADSGAARFDIDLAQLTWILAEAAEDSRAAVEEAGLERFLKSLHLEELVLARACEAGHNRAWEEFLARYRGTLYETAYNIAKEESAAKGLADSLYAELYGVDDKSGSRNSKLHYYLGRGSLQGWLRAVVAQEYVNQYRQRRRETSLEAAVDDGRQFAAAQPDIAVVDSRLEAATQTELASLNPEERFLMAAYYLDGRTLAEIAGLMRVHESTISRRLNRVVAGLRIRIRKRLVKAGMPARQANEAMEEIDVRDLGVPVGETLRQGKQSAAFFRENSGDQG